MRNPDIITLQPRIDSVGMDRVLWVDKIPLTDGYPHPEQSWNIPDLNGGQADTMPLMEGTHE